ncbi:MAG: hypothetical protein L0312_16335, partial [Acidobacteria bacterium]|nr:hypothetical protein [Acidobacteriota bacterium]
APFRSCDEYACLELGRPYDDLVQVLNEIRSEADISLIGFHEMDEDQIVRHTDLNQLQARLAARREYDEPFLILGRTSPAKMTNLKSLAAQRGCKIVQGGRFCHLTGRTDKGRAARILMRFYRAAQEIKTFIGLGDCENDLSLLESVDVPILMANPDGGFNAQVLRRIPYVRRAPAGPEGWMQSVTRFLQYQES